MQRVILIPQHVNDDRKMAYSSNSSSMICGMFSLFLSKNILLSPDLSTRTSFAFDDAVTGFCQAGVVERNPRVFRFLGAFLSLCVSTECFVALPILLLSAGRKYDPRAARVIWLCYCTCTLAQLPKRFIWRSRPWMESRAIPLKENKSSSFPSRDNVHAVILLYILCIVYNFTSWAAFAALSVASFIPIAMVRVILGAHYATDCLAGFLSAFVILVIGEAVSVGDDQMCEAIYSSDLWPTPLEDRYVGNRVIIVGVVALAGLQCFVMNMQTVEQKHIHNYTF